MGVKRISGFKTTHLGTKRYRCKSQWNKKQNKYVYPIHKLGNYEALLSFKALPSYKEVKDKGRKWIYTKNYQPIMDRLFLDIDCSDLQTAYEVTKSIMQDLADYQDYINVYFSGSKGFHIELLTEELDIIDITVDKPMDSCYQYVEFLNYFMDKYPEVDLSLKDVGTRIIRIHHTKHESTGNYKILVDINASLDTILESSKADKDMVEPVTTALNKDKALYLLKTHNKPIEDKPQSAIDEFDVVLPAEDDSIFAVVYNELNTNIHDKIKLIGCGLNGYVSRDELERIYTYLSNTTDIEDSNNAKQSFIDAYENDKAPCNLGALKNHYDNNNIDPTNFYDLSNYLKAKLENKSYDDFMELMELYEYDWFDMLEDKLYDYISNTTNVFDGLMQCLMALFGYGSRFIVVNGGSEVGKSEYINTLKKLIPTMKFKNLGSSTPASIRRKQEQAFNKKVAYLGDKGLKGKDDEEFKGLLEVFGGLITEGEFIRDVVDGTEVKEFRLESDGICAIYTEPFTNLRVFGAGDQYITRSTYITVNPVSYEDGLNVFLEDENNDNPFYPMHRRYISHILKNPIKLALNKKVLIKLYEASNGSLRTAKYLRGLFKAYCQYLQITEPGIADVESFLDVFNPQFEVTQIELMIYDKLYHNLKVLESDDLEYKLADDGAVGDFDDMLLQMKGRKNKSFFTAKQVKTYFKKDLQNNKNLKDTIDQIPDILNNLYNASYIERLDWQYNGQNVYYLPYNEDMGD